MANDDLGDRMKQWEAAEAGRVLLPGWPACARVDGRNFSRFSKGLARPYDERLAQMMIETTRYLAAETNAVIGYTQSDEISLAWMARTTQEQIFFAGRVQKMVSQLAAMTTAYFNRLGALRDDDELTWRCAQLLPTFDARVWNVPDTGEGANVFLWRELDAQKNSVSMLARCHFSYRQLDGLVRADQKAMLLDQGVDWESYPAHFKRGTFIQRRVVERAFTTAEIEALPPLHEARRNPGLVVARTEYRTLAMPPFISVSNRAAVVFEGAEPEAGT